MRTQLIQIILLFMYLIGMKPLQAQQVHAGLQLGLIGTDMREMRTGDPTGGPGPYEFDPGLGYRVNAVFLWTSESPMSFSIEPGYKRARVRVNNTASKLILRCLNLPMAAHLDLPYRFFVSAGLETSYYYGSFHTNGGNAVLIPESRFEVAGLLGLGYRVLDHVDLTMRYVHTFNPTQSITSTNVNGQIVWEYSFTPNALEFLVKVDVFDL